MNNNTKTVLIFLIAAIMTVGIILGLVSIAKQPSPLFRFNQNTSCCSFDEQTGCYVIEDSYGNVSVYELSH